MSQDDVFLCNHEQGQYYYNWYPYSWVCDYPLGALRILFKPRQLHRQTLTLMGAELSGLGIARSPGGRFVAMIIEGPTVLLEKPIDVFVGGKNRVFQNPAIVRSQVH